VLVMPAHACATNALPIVALPCASEKAVMDLRARGHSPIGHWNVDHRSHAGDDYQINYPSSFVLDTAVCIPDTADPLCLRRCVLMHHISIHIQTPPDYPFSTLWEEFEVHPVENMRKT